MAGPIIPAVIGGANVIAKALKGRKRKQDKKKKKLEQLEAERKKKEKEIEDLKKQSKTVTEEGVKVTKVPPQKDPKKVTAKEKSEPGSGVLRPDASDPTHTRVMPGQIFKKGGPVKKCKIDGIAKRGFTKAYSMKKGK